MGALQRIDILLSQEITRGKPVCSEWFFEEPLMPPVRLTAKDPGEGQIVGPGAEDLPSPLCSAVFL